jgi:hypothetical protein
MANQLKTIQGVVKATAQNAPERFGLRIGPEWYDGFGECPVERGAEVEVRYTDNGKYHDLQEVAVVEPGRAEEPAVGESASVEESAEVVRITRAVALKCAATVRSSSKAEAEDVVYDAEIFERWLRRAGPR